MKREAKLLLNKACDSLILAIEFFNRPHDRGRITSTLIMLDHAFEMLLKAAILHLGGRIRDRRVRETIGFDTCVRRSLNNGSIKYLTEEQALTLQTINGLRDAAQHHLLDISEGQLYIHVQSGVTLFRDLLKSVFNRELAVALPARVFPVSTSVFTDLAILFDSEIKEIKNLLQPSRRRRVEALARLRPLAILDATVQGEKSQPSDTELGRLGNKLIMGKSWEELFPGVAALEIKTEGMGPTISFHLSKKEGIPIQLVAEGTPGSHVLAVRRVDELSYYSLGARDLAEKVGLSLNKLLALIDYLNLRKNPDYYKEIKIGKSIFKCYSSKAIPIINDALNKESIDRIWKKYRQRFKRISISHTKNKNSKDIRNIRMKSLYLK